MEHSEGGVAQTKGEGVEGWAVKTQETIASVKKGVSLSIVYHPEDHVMSCDTAPSFYSPFRPRCSA